LAILLAVFEVFFAKDAMRALLHRRPEVTFDEKSLDFSLVRGRFHVEGLKITNPRNPGEDLFEAKRVEAKIDLVGFSRGQLVIETLELDSPALLVVREEDG